MPTLLPRPWLDMDLESLARLAPVQRLDWPLLDGLGLQVALKREDLLHPELGGNKLYKLHGHLRRARACGHSHLVSFGGAWSNHVYALAAAGRDLGLRVTVVIRGERPVVPSAMLRDVEAAGAHLYFVSRSDYRNKHSEAFRVRLERDLGDFYLIPEGGGDAIGASGCRSLGRALAHQWQTQAFDTVCCAVGTGGTLAGLVAGMADGVSAGELPQNVTVCGFSVLKGRSQPDLSEVVGRQLRELASAPVKWDLERKDHWGGYARYPEELAQFVQQLESVSGVLFDPVYTAKMMAGIARKALAGDWPPGSRILALHSGGLQGRRGFANKLRPSSAERADSIKPAAATAK